MTTTFSSPDLDRVVGCHRQHVVRKRRPRRTTARRLWVTAAVITVALCPVLMITSREMPHSTTNAEPASATQLELAALLAGSYVRQVDGDVVASIPAERIPVFLGDATTRVISEAEYQKFLDGQTRSTVGVGALVINENRLQEISKVLHNSPAERAGLRAGDMVTSVDGVVTDLNSTGQTVAMIRGPIGRPLRMTLERDGTPIEVTVDRDDATDWSVAAELRVSGRHRIGYVTLADMNESSGDRVRSAVHQLLEDKAEAIVLDMRGSGGDLASDAVAVSEVFLPAASPVVIERGAHIPTRLMATASAPEDAHVPLAVLIDDQTANSAEIVAGALGDDGRAQLIGARTSGSGSRITVAKLQAGGALMFANAEYVTPSGLSLADSGLTPDVATSTQTVGSRDPAFNVALATVLMEVVRQGVDTG
jgi:carboxyl-terminal processing protease